MSISKPTQSTLHACELYQLCSRLVALTAIYDNASLEQAAQWLQDDVQSTTDEEDRDSLRDMRDVLMRGVSP